jgi:hypothetical protein
MSTRIQLTISTNYGDIENSWDLPPFMSDKIGAEVQRAFVEMDQKLYDAHVARGGLFMGEPGCNDWMDKNGRTVIKESNLSPRVSRT